MAIQYINSKGERKQLADKQLFVGAVRLGEIRPDTLIYVSSKNAFVPAQEIFDFAAFRRREQERKTAPVSNTLPRTPDTVTNPPAPKKRTSRLLVAFAGLCVFGFLKIAVLDRLDEIEGRSKNIDKQVAVNELKEIKAHLTPTTPEAKPAAASVPVAGKISQDELDQLRQFKKLVLDHLDDLQKQNDTYDKNVAAMLGDDFMTSESFTSNDGRSRNTERIRLLALAMEERYTLLMNKNRMYWEALRRMRGNQPSAQADADIQKITTLIDICRENDRKMTALYTTINDAAKTARPTYKQQTLVFRDQKTMDQWQSLWREFDRLREIAAQNAKEAEAIERDGVERFQKQIDRL